MLSNDIRYLARHFTTRGNIRTLIIDEEMAIHLQRELSVLATQAEQLERQAGAPEVDFDPQTVAADNVIFLRRDGSRFSRALG